MLEQLKARLPPGLKTVLRTLMARWTNPAAPASVPGFAIARYSGAPAELSAEAMRELVADLNMKADHLGCVVFEGQPGHTGVVVIFAGHTERFFMLPVARLLSCRVIYFQDLHSGWFQGSHVLPSLPDLCRTILKAEVGDQPCLFFGQSSGGYAALAASTFHTRATVVACAPQTFSDADAKNGIGFVGLRPLSTPNGLMDIKDLLSGADAADLRSVLIAASEAENPYTAHYWMDYLHALRVKDAASVALFVVKAQSHVIVHGRLAAFAGLLRSLVDVQHAARPEKLAILGTFLTTQFD